MVKRTKLVFKALASPGGTSEAFVNYGGRSGRHDRKSGIHGLADETKIFAFMW